MSEVTFHILCEHCGKNGASCLGKYDAMEEEAFACDDCCGHAGEDGYCNDITELKIEVYKLEKV